MASDSACLKSLTRRLGAPLPGTICEVLTRWKQADVKNDVDLKENC